MQLFAFNLHNQLVAAVHAEKHCDYICLECQKAVRLRGGRHRQKHYYHLQINQACSLHRKSMEHIQVQTYLYHLLPENDCVLECPFPTVSRIADVVWKSKKLIFEVQCSPITQEEVQNRCQDYRSCGYEIIWILHEKTFNRWKLCAAEVFLQDQTHYFTNMNKEGKGMIYDCYASIERGVRKKRMKSVEVQLNLPTLLNESGKNLPQFLKKRLETWHLHFEGDLVTRFFNQAYDFQEIISIEQKNETKPLTWIQAAKYALYFCIMRPYRLVFQLFLEKHSN